ncbi:methyl-accepting chemotaxis protein [Nocardioides pakistanensis]
MTTSQSTPEPVAAPEEYQPAKGSLLSRGSLLSKLLAASFMMAVVLIGQGLLATSQQAKVHDRVEVLAERDLVPLADLRAAQQTGFQMTIKGLVADSAQDPAVVERMSAQRDELSGLMGTQLETMLANTPAELRGHAEELVDGWEAFVAADQAYLQGAAGPDAAALNARAAELFDELNTAFDAQADRLTADAAEQRSVVDDMVGSSRTVMFSVVGVGVLLAVVLGVVLARSLRRRIEPMVAALVALAKGDLSHDLEVEGTDELAVMGQNLHIATASLRGMVVSLAESAESLDVASDQMAQVATTISESAEETAGQSHVVSAAADQVSRNVQTVATGGEEMTASIGEIARSTSEASQVGVEAVALAQETNELVARLGASSAEIVGVVNVITGIAEQTNLLALNATIEAARAGESGKGFAVVAGEVKDLAQETAKATEDISRRVEAIQADTASAVSSIAQITEVIARLDTFQATIASAVEEQAATTQEMSRNIAETASGAGQIAENIVAVAGAAEATSGGVHEIRAASEELRRTSHRLREVVEGFCC